MTRFAPTGWLEWIEIRVAELSAAAMLVMVLSVTFDVFMRYTLHAPLAWSYDLVSMYLMPAVVFFPIAMTQQGGHHINVDIFHRRMPPRLRAVSSAVGLLGAAVILAIIAGLAGKRAWTGYIANEVVSGPIAWPTWIGPAILAAGAALFVIRALVNAGMLLFAGGRNGTANNASGDAA